MADVDVIGARHGDEETGLIAGRVLTIRITSVPNDDFLEINCNGLDGSVRTCRLSVDSLLQDFCNEVGWKSAKFSTSDGIVMNKLSRVNEFQEIVMIEEMLVTEPEPPPTPSLVHLLVTKLTPRAKYWAAEACGSLCGFILAVIICILFVVPFVRSIFWMRDMFETGESSQLNTISFVVFAPLFSIAMCGLAGKEIYNAVSKNRLGASVKEWAAHGCANIVGFLVTMLFTFVFAHAGLWVYVMIETGKSTPLDAICFATMASLFSIAIGYVVGVAIYKAVSENQLGEKLKDWVATACGSIAGGLLVALFSAIFVQAAFWVIDMVETGESTPLKALCFAVVMSTLPIAICACVAKEIKDALNS